MDRNLDILLVEDDNFDVLVFKKTLLKIAPTATVTHAADGVAALEIIRSGVLPEHYVVISDINMPRMNGHEFVEYLRQESDCSRNIVFIFTTSDNPDDIETAYNNKVNGYIVKPNSSESLANILRCIRDFWNICELPPATA